MKKTITITKKPKKTLILTKKSSSQPSPQPEKRKYFRKGYA